MTAPLSGKVVVITAAGSAPGSALAAELHALGATLVLADSNAKTLYAAATPLRAVAMLADISSPMACGEIVSRCVQKLGRIDALVHIANPPPTGPANDEATFTRTVETCLKPAYFLAAHALPALAVTKGALVFALPDAGDALMAMVSGGLDGLARALGQGTVPVHVGASDASGHARTLCTLLAAGPWQQGVSDTAEWMGGTLSKETGH